MKKNAKLIILIGIGVVSTLFLYLATNNLIFTLVNLALWVLYSFLFARKKILLFDAYQQRLDDCVKLINSFVVTLSIKLNIKEAFDDVKVELGESLRKEIELFHNDDPLITLNNLIDYFKLDVYQIFVETLTLYSNEGGDVFVLFKEVLEKISNENRIFYQEVYVAKRSFITITTLWVLSLLILPICRFAISSFYVEIMNNIIFGLAIFFIYALVLFSYHIFIMNSVSKRGKNNAKN